MPSPTKNITALAALQGLLITNNITVISLGSLTGYMLAQDKALATLPSTAYIAGGACSTFLLSQLMRRYGRRAGFTVGALAGMAGAAVCTAAIAVESFWLFCLGAMIAGLYTAAGGYYRFAAADLVPGSFKSRAISFVLAGGIIGGVLGPESSKITKSLHIIGMFAPALFAGWLIRRFGILRIMGAGVALYVVCVIAALEGERVINFWLSGTLLGAGWCFLYVGATTLLTEAYRPEEKAKAQGLNDMLVFAVMGISSAISGAILYRQGWNALNLSALPFLIATGTAVIWLALHRRARYRATAPTPAALD